MHISKAVAKRIKILCKEKNISINRLATLSGVTQSTIDSILKGKSRNPQLVTLMKISNGLGISIVEFFDFPPLINAEYDE
ncbi:MAG: helix-turn-helix transcriptional regulator [Bacteroidales bacterium]|jgi:transcriptional regulator with XRE-family HTH domain